MTGSDRLLIVIPCLNEEEHLPRLLDQFISDNPEALIVVADGGSTDSSCSIVLDRANASTNVILLDNPQRIQGPGVNLAVECYGHDRHWLLRVDAHCDYPPHYARVLIETAHLRGAASVVVPIVSCGSGIFQTAVAAAQNSVLGTGGSPHRHIGKGAYVDHGHHALMSLSEFEAVGGYCAYMAANEDAELDMRLSARGTRIWLEPSLAVTYYPRSNARGLWRQYFNYGSGRSRTLRLHRARPKLRQLAPIAAAAAAMLALLAPVWPWFAAPAFVWLCLTLLAGIFVGASTGKPAALLAGFAASIMHLSWGLGFVLETLRLRRSYASTAAQQIQSLRVSP